MRALKDYGVLSRFENHFLSETVVQQSPAAVSSKGNGGKKKKVVNKPYKGITKKQP